MTGKQWKGVFKRATNDVMNHHTMAFAAGLSYYFMMGLFPALIALAAVVAYLPIPNLFESILQFMSSFVPQDSMGLVRGVVADIITPRKGTLLSFGILGTFWAISTGFAALMEALNIAYDVPETRPIWKTRLLAMVLSLQIGGMLMLGLTLILVGPKFGLWAAQTLHISHQFAVAWPYLRWGVSVSVVVLAVEIMYFAGPNVRQKFRYTAFGAVIAVVFWILLTYLLGLYYRDVANLNKTYGALGGVIALMNWLQWTAMALLIGAEINSEILKVQTEGEVPLKYERRRISRVKPGSEWAA